MRRNKFGAKKVEIDGIVFASSKEGRRYSELKLLERAGEISGLEIQPKFKFVIDGRPVLIRSKGYPNGRQASYRADFAYFCKRRGKRICEDVKSQATRTEAYALRRALVEAMFPGTLIEEV
jgi:hypothetical protein